MSIRNHILIALGLLTCFFIGMSIAQDNLWFLILAGLTIGLISFVFTQYPSSQVIYQSKLTAEKRDHYAAHGLSSRETRFFRQEMAKAREHIIRISNKVTNDQRLMMLFQRYDANNLLQAYFKSIVQSPEALDHATRFIYQSLPELNQHFKHYQNIKTLDLTAADERKAQREMLNEIEQIIQNIQHDYISFKRKDIPS